MVHLHKCGFMKEVSQALEAGWEFFKEGILCILGGQNSSELWKTNISLALKAPWPMGKEGARQIQPSKGGPSKIRGLFYLSWRSVLFSKLLLSCGLQYSLTQASWSFFQSPILAHFFSPSVGPSYPMTALPRSVPSSNCVHNAMHPWDNSLSIVSKGKDSTTSLMNMLH